MKAILEFDLEEERDEFNLACRADEFRRALMEIDHELRDKMNYMDEDPTYDEARKFLGRLRDLIPWYLEP